MLSIECGGGGEGDDDDDSDLSPRVRESLFDKKQTKQVSAGNVLVVCVLRMNLLK